MEPLLGKRPRSLENRATSLPGSVAAIDLERSVPVVAKTNGKVDIMTATAIAIVNAIVIGIDPETGTGTGTGSEVEIEIERRIVNAHVGTVQNPLLIASTPDTTHGGPNAIGTILVLETEIATVTRPRGLPNQKRTRILWSARHAIASGC